MGKTSIDSRGRTSGIVTKSGGGTTLNSEADVYGSSGDLNTKTVNGTTTTYGYDSDDQLTSESSPSYSESYTYDGNGNRLTKTLGSVTDSYTYDNGDKLESVKEGSTTIKSYSYDAQGRTTSVVSSAGTTSMSYDYEDRMTSITLPSGRTDTYTYNGEDTRTGMNSSAGTQTFKRAGAGVTAPVLSDGLASYTPGVSRHTSSGSTFYGTDRQGTDSLQTTATGTVAATKVYDGFGMLVSSTGTPVGPFGYNGASGYQEDADTGLMLLGHRYYDSSTGRFITRDPAKDGSNWYDYARNNPLINIDSTGLYWVFARDLKVLVWIDPVSGIPGPVVNGSFSGRKGMRSSKYEKVKDKGPLPGGWYRIMPPSKFKGKHGGIVHGNPLVPMPGTKTHGRGGFWIHPGNINGDPSDGCVIPGKGTSTKEIWKVAKADPYLLVM